MLPYISLIFMATFAATSHSQILSRESSCDTGYVRCAPSSVKSISTPQIGDPGFQSLYSNLISSSLPSSDPNKSPPRTPQSTSGDSPSLCCSQYLQCMTLSRILIPFCYSRFTTNFFLPDGSYGTVTSGSYMSASGVTANFFSGEYKFENGTTGNIYAGNEVARPNTKTLALPSQYTGKGVGTAVPASELGAVVTVKLIKTVQVEDGGLSTETITTVSALSRAGDGTTGVVVGSSDVESLTTTTGQSEHGSPGATTTATMEYSLTFTFSSIHTGTMETNSATSIGRLGRGMDVTYAALLLSVSPILVASLW